MTQRNRNVIKKKKLKKNFLSPLLANFLGGACIVIAFLVGVYLWNSYAPNSSAIILDGFCSNNLSNKDIESLERMIKGDGILTLESFDDRISSFYSTIITLLTLFIAFLAVFLQVHLKNMSKIEIREQIQDLIDSGEVLKAAQEAVRKEGQEFMTNNAQDILDDISALNGTQSAILDNIETLETRINEVDSKVDSLSAKVDSLSTVMSKVFDVISRIKSWFKKG